jgi:2-polyprenyl-3-methyl-5-hydroxy-6-metoxy-1,4-benzoquinol methylase
MNLALETDVQLSVVAQALNAPSDDSREAIDTEPVPTCVLCGSARSKRLFQLPPFGYVACSRCGLVRLSPRVASRNLASFYDGLYREPYEHAQETLTQQLANPTFAYRASRLTTVATGRRLFEIGCGDGNFLAVMRARGWDVAGSEVHASAVRVARERHGLQLQSIGFEDFRIPGDGYDAIGAYHVLEHLYEPRDVLQGIRDALIPGGVLHLQLPNIGSIDGRLGRQSWFGLRCPKHVTFYEPRHLRRLLAEEGFRVVSIETYDPWHSPGAMELTLRALARRAYRRAVGVIRRQGSSPVTSASPTIAVSSPPRHLRGLPTLARFLAQAEARVGLGNVADVIAMRR